MQLSTYMGLECGINYMYLYNSVKISILTFSLYVARC